MAHCTNRISNFVCNAGTQSAKRRELRLLYPGVHQAGVLKEYQYGTFALTQKTSSKKRSREDEEEVVTNRPKYLRKSTPLWRDACRSAGDIYDRELPSLEEASHLFGYASAI